MSRLNAKERALLLKIHDDPHERVTFVHTPPELGGLIRRRMVRYTGHDIVEDAHGTSYVSGHELTPHGRHTAKQLIENRRRAETLRRAAIIGMAPPPAWDGELWAQWSALYKRNLGLRQAAKAEAFGERMFANRMGASKFVLLCTGRTSYSEAEKTLDSDAASAQDETK